MVFGMYWGVIDDRSIRLGEYAIAHLFFVAPQGSFIILSLVQRRLEEVFHFREGGFEGVVGKGRLIRFQEELAEAAREFVKSI